MKFTLTFTKQTTRKQIEETNENFKQHPLGDVAEDSAQLGDFSTLNNFLENRS